MQLTEQPQEPNQLEQIHPTTTASQPAAEVQESTPNPLPGVLQVTTHLDTGLCMHLVLECERDITVKLIKA